MNWFQKALLIMLLGGFGTAGATGLGVAWSNAKDVATLLESDKIRQRDHDLIIVIEQEVKYINREQKKQDKKLDTILEQTAPHPR